MAQAITTPNPTPEPAAETVTEWLQRVQAEWPRDAQDAKRAEENKR